MAVLPESRAERITLVQVYTAGPWAAHADEIGLDPAAVAALAAKAAAARAAAIEHGRAIAAARAATQVYYAAVDAMSADAAVALKRIKAAAAVDGDEVYTLAQVPPPADRSPVPPPGTPTRFTAALTAVGSVVIGWKCRNPRGSRGTVYEVQRRVGVAGPFQYLGATGAKTFVDDTLPAGAAAEVTYQVTAVRSTKRGAEARFTVHFGVAGGGGAVAGVPKLAA